MKTYRIGEASDATGMSAHTIRFYESRGLLPAAARSGSGYRSYNDSDLRRLRLVHNARRLRIPLPEIEALVEDIHDSTCGEYAGRVLALVEREQAKVDQQIAELERIRTDLASLAVDASSASRSDRQVGECDCCLLMDERGKEAEYCQPIRPVPERFAGEMLEILQCDIDARPEAPTPVDLAPYLLGSTIASGRLVIRFSPPALELVRQFAAAECVCCGGMGWIVSEKLGAVLLTVSGTEEQLAVITTSWLLGASEAVVL